MSENAQRVQCAACGWKGARVYVPEGQLGTGHNTSRESGFGPCRSCGQRTLKRTGSTRHHVGSRR